MKKLPMSDESVPVVKVAEFLFESAVLRIIAELERQKDTVCQIQIPNHMAWL